LILLGPFVHPFSAELLAIFEASALLERQPVNAFRQEANTNDSMVRCASSYSSSASKRTQSTKYCLLPDLNPIEKMWSELKEFSAAPKSVPSLPLFRHYLSFGGDHTAGRHKLVCLMRP